MDHVHLKWVNNAYLKIITDQQTFMDIHSHLELYAPNYKHHPRFKKTNWNGKIQMLNKFDQTTYTGLARHIKKFCDDRGLRITWDHQFEYVDVTPEQVVEHIEYCNLPDDIKTTDDYSYQPKAVWKALRSNRRTLEIGTSGGKSLVIYLLHRWYKRHYQNNKSLIIVPTKALVRQFAGDMRDYGYDGILSTSEDANGLSRDNDIQADVVITTWQAINNKKAGERPPEWYKQFTTVFGDEAHECAAASLIEIMSKMVNAKHRFGLTGTMPDWPLTRATVEGLFGPHHFVIDARGLIERGVSTDIEIKQIILEHPQWARDLMHANGTSRGAKTTEKYKKEFDYLVKCRMRTLAIAKLALKLKGNRVVFFRTIDHGKLIHKAILALDPKANVVYIDGSVTGKKRDEYRKMIEDAEDVILLASLGTTKRGVNIKKLHHAIMAAPTKSKSNVVQPIGRLLRKHSSKDKVIMYDFVDDFSTAGWKNYTLLHGINRFHTYKKERHPVTTKRVALKYK